MPKTRILLLTLIIAFIFGAAFSIAGESMKTNEMCIPMGVITLSPPKSVDAKRSPVEFNHSHHFGIKCNDCHHKWKKDTPIEGCTTSGCHELTESPLKIGGSKFEGKPEILYYKKAFHQNCIRCHRDIKASNEKLELTKGTLPDQLPATGPTGCIECHPTD